MVQSFCNDKKPTEANFPDLPRTELLDMGVIQQLAAKCTSDNQVDLIKLHQMIKIELAPQVEGAANLLELETEVRIVLRWIQQSNHENDLVKERLPAVQSFETYFVCSFIHK